MKFDAELFARFLAMLPKDTDDAAKLAKRHDDRLESAVTGWKAMCSSRFVTRWRFATTVFAPKEFIELLRKHHVGAVCADTVEWPRLMDVTADFVYCRLHGSEELYVSGYDDAALDAWAKRIAAWARGHEPEDAHRVLPPLKTSAKGRDVFVYFDNDVKVRAPTDARSLAQRLGVATPFEEAAMSAKPRRKGRRSEKEEARPHWPSP